MTLGLHCLTTIEKSVVYRARPSSGLKLSIEELGSSSLID